MFTNAAVSNMRFLSALVSLYLFGTAVCLGPAEFTLSPQGTLTVRIPADGYNRVAVHMNINQPLPELASGTFAHDLTTPNNGYFEWQTSAPAKEGDTINYWLWAEKGGLGETGQVLSYTITAPTTTQRPTTATPRPITAAPKVTSTLPNRETPTPGVTLPNRETPAPIVTSTLPNRETPSPGVTLPNRETPAPVTLPNRETPAPSGSGSQTSTSGSSQTSGTSSGGSGSGVVHTGGVQQQAQSAQCQSYPCLIFEDNFNTLDFSVWEHEITASGGGNWEFEYYTNNRSNSYVKDGVLYIKPTLTSDHYGEKFLTSGNLELWGGSSGDMCTSNMWWGCMRQGSADHIINPIQSARLRSTRGFTMKYGKVEIEAKMPKGDWIWPAIWMLPKWNAYGQWPASGEIDIVESRGNLNYHDEKGLSQGVDSIGSTLHFGPGYPYDPFEKAHAEKKLTSGTFADAFHKFGVEWDETMIKFTVDGEEILKTVPPAGGFWELGEFDKIAPGMDNPWRGASKIAPFDQEFYLIMNVAVGGVGYFPDTFRNSPTPKPWHDKSDFTARDFWNARNQWYPTWNPDKNHGEDAAMKVNYVKVWKMHA